MNSEAKVGLVFISTVALICAFAYYLGALNPFSDTHSLNIAYNFAGGIEVGSPVRVMGIKVGKVSDIQFRPEFKMPDGEEVKLNIEIEVSKKAWGSLKTDSKFFINLAGVIGEKFLEITPGSLQAETLKPGATLRGEDPPRIDQLISQSYSLAGKVVEMLEKNEGSINETIKTINQLTVNLNKVLKQANSLTGNKELTGLLENLGQLTQDLAFFSNKMRSKEGLETIKLVNELIHRLKGLDGKAISKFLQEEGIKAKLF